MVAGDGMVAGDSDHETGDEVVAAVGLGQSRQETETKDAAAITAQG